jgi:uncharacterized protein (TIGR02421 family)
MSARSGDPKTTTATAISDSFVQSVCERLRQNKRVRRSLPVWGRISIDRQLPFLCIYRRPAGVADSGTDRFATSEASYLVCSGRKNQRSGVSNLVREVAKIMVDEFGAFLVLELWAGPPTVTSGPVTTAELAPHFRVIGQRGSAESFTVDEFEEHLSRVRLLKQKAVVSAGTSARCSPPRMAPLFGADTAREIGCQVYGLEIAPIYRDPESGELFPHVVRSLRRQSTVALRRTFYNFSLRSTTHRPGHFHALGRRAVVKAVWDVDRMLADVSEEFEFLLQVTPVNGEQAWREFKRRGFERRPAFHYRPLPAEPVILKRQLYKAPVERIEDPALASVFREKLDEIDRQITMLQDRNTSRFLYESIQLYGGVEDELYELALRILDSIPPRSRERGRPGTIGSVEFAARAREEIDYLRQQHEEPMEARVEVRGDVTGLLVSRGNLLVSDRARIPVSRVEALIQHEVGTHVLTYHNGRAQRLRHLYTGFAGYDALQEGLAVLAEYLVGGLSRPRLRLLAARVVAGRFMIDGATFVDTFRSLDQTFGLASRTAFVVTMRTYRGGGLTKDAVYLRGLVQILDYIAKGGEIETLFVGKIATKHIPIIRELQWRGVLTEAPLVPRYMNDSSACARLETLKAGGSLLDLIERKR